MTDDGAPLASSDALAGEKADEIGVSTPSNDQIPQNLYYLAISGHGCVS